MKKFLWLTFGGGIGGAIGLFILGLFWCVTIVGLPLGKKCLRMAKASLTLKENVEVPYENTHKKLDTVWFVLGGCIVCLRYTIGKHLLKIFPEKPYSHIAERYSKATRRPLDAQILFYW